MYNGDSEPAAAKEPAKEYACLQEIVRRSLLGAQHLMDIAEHARELADKVSKGNWGHPGREPARETLLRR